MNIGILIPNVGNFGKVGFYNSQEIGLAKELVNKGQNVTIFKFMKGNSEGKTDVLTNGCTLIQIPVKNIGINGIIDNFDFMKEYGLKKLICFSDTQIIVKRLKRFCDKEGIEFIPYIGTITSSNPSSLTKSAMKFFALRNIKIYRSCKKVLVKTPQVFSELKDLKIKNLYLSPVGLDFQLMKDDDGIISKNMLKSELGFNDKDRIILFVGRLDSQKKPLLAVDILNEIRKIDKSYKMIMIGSGVLKDEVIKKVKSLNLNDSFKYIEKVRNSEMWKYYSASECFINLNDEEIFGMAILESMYYRCPVYAINAPGPNFIINDKKNSFIIDDLKADEFVNCILETKDSLDSIRDMSKKRIVENFSWKICADNVLEG